MEQVKQSCQELCCSSLFTSIMNGCVHISNAYQMKSVQWLQKVGCLKNLAVNLWFFTSWTFFWRRAPLRANRFPIAAESL